MLRFLPDIKEAPESKVGGVLQDEIFVCSINAVMRNEYTVPNNMS